MVIQNDWKAYQVLSLEQNWNSGSDSSSKVEAAAQTEQMLMESEYRGKWGLVRFPLHAFVYERKSEPGEALPTALPIAYRDLTFPRLIEGRRYLGASRLKRGDRLVLESSPPGVTTVNWFLKGAQNLAEGAVIGTVRVGEETVPLRVGPAIESGYQMALCRSIEGSRVVDSWRKRPLISQAARYPQSLVAAEGIIYESIFHSTGSVELEISQPNIELFILVPWSDALP
jgi:hypothetical protein